MNKFQVGDTVKCIDAVQPLVFGQEYTVAFVGVSEPSVAISMEGPLSGKFFSWRFAPIEQPSLTQPSPTKWPTPFWLVKGSGPARFHHKSLHSAQVEAERLAKDNPGSEFTVLAPVETFVASEMVRHIFTESELEEVPPF